MIAKAERLLYVGHYLRQQDWPLLAKFMEHVTEVNSWSKASQWQRAIYDSLRFNISILEYYQFRFFELSDVEKRAWAGTGTMYEFQRRMNPLDTRDILRDKRRFYRAYGRFFRHEMYTCEELKEDHSRTVQLLSDNQTLVLKEATGNCGAGVSFTSTAGLTPSTLLEAMEAGRYDIAETLVCQHPVLQELSPSAVNTVRIFTQIRSNGNYEVLGCRQRISVNSPVDNLAAGNLAAPIDRDSGVIKGPGVYSDITREPEKRHPVTGVSIVGFQIPYWRETLEMVREASLLHPENRSIGWDVVVTEEGPGLIEGNHDWCKLVWQLPVNRGLKSRLEFG